MANIHVRDIPDSVVAALDGRARERGVSRNTLAVEALEAAARAHSRPATAEDLARFTARFPLLADDDAIAAAWRG